MKWRNLNLRQNIFGKYSTRKWHHGNVNEKYNDYEREIFF